MQRAIGTPGMGAWPLANFAGGRKAAIGSLEGEGRQGGQPVKPRGGIREQGKHSPCGTNGQIAAVSPIVDEGQRPGTSASPAGCGIERCLLLWGIVQATRAGVLTSPWLGRGFGLAQACFPAPVAL